MNVIHCFRRYFSFVASCVLVTGLAVAASAQTVLIDFGNDFSFRGLSSQSPDSKGNRWNSLQPGLPALNLIDIQNNPTVLDLYFDTPVATDSYNGPAGATAPAPPGFPHYYDFLPLTDIDAAVLGNMGGSLEAAFDYAASPGIGTIDPNGVQTDNKTRFQIQELDPAKKYDLSFFASHKYEGDIATVFSVYSDDTYSTLVQSVSLNVRDPSDPSLHNRDTIATLSNLSPQTDSILYVQFVGSTGDLGYLNDMRIVATTPPLNGDYNDNGKVDGADYVVWRNNVGTTNTLPHDPTGGIIGATQYNTWRSNFGLGSGAGSGLGAGAAVPEPMSLTLFMGGAIGLSIFNRRR